MIITGKRARVQVMHNGKWVDVRTETRPVIALAACSKGYATTRKTCDACGSKRPRHTIPGDPVRRLCHDCNFSNAAGALINLGASVGAFASSLQSATRAVRAAFPVRD